MDDSKLIELYFQRSEDAIAETEHKYGRLCRHIAMNILANAEDSEECVNDAYLGAWNAIPPQRPVRFSAFLGKITRNLALKRHEYASAAKRNPGVIASLDELADCVSGEASVESELENRRIEKAISDFLWQQETDKRMVFVRRYWYFASIADISAACGYRESKVTSMLFQLRKKLKAHLEREGIEL